MLVIYSFLITSAVIFGIGIYGFITRRNMLKMLMSAEVMFNGALLALLALSRASMVPAKGGILALIAISLAASEIGVMVSLAILIFRIKRTIDVYELRRHRG